ncbi:MAG: UDP-4-amino-4,6-dideoxy-N-acetyl-beta-L-altrosamine transaminase [Rhodospirillaceae bacterium]
MIPYGRQSIDEDDIDAVVRVLRSDFLTQGPAVPAFEQAVAASCGAAEAVACSSATAALHMACLALDVGPGDLVWTSPITFVASANCALYCGAEVGFVDIDPDTFTMSPQRLAEALAQARAAGRLPKVVIPVHMCGQSCDMAAIHALSREYGFHVIEDASHALGGSYRGQPVGSCRYSDIAVFSLHPVKIITSGEGGLALTNDPVLAERLRVLRSHGIVRDPAMMTEEPEGAWVYEQVSLGFNYRLSDLQAALGLSQFRRLETFITRRRALAARYAQALGGRRDIVLPAEADGAQSSWHLYVIRLAEPAHRRQAFDMLRAAGIGVQVHYIPVHRQPFHARQGFRAGAFPAAEDYYARAISLPMFPALDDREQDRVIATVHGVLDSLADQPTSVIEGASGAV